MCGRYVSISDEDYTQIRTIVDEVSEMYKSEINSRREIFPTNKVPFIYTTENRKILSLAKWGFPNFKNNGVIINARSETIIEKPMFRKSFITKRCALPASGYYEWLTDEHKKKTKYQISVKGKDLFYMGGIYNIFNDKEGQAYSAVTIITTDANQDVSFIHNRMPVILNDDTLKIWLDIDNENAQSLLLPYEVNKMEYKVA